MHVLVAVLGRVRGVHERDEVGRDELGALVDQLVEGVLAVGARLAPEDLSGLGGDRGAVPTHGLAVGLHGQLLQVGREAVQVLVVRQHGVGGDLEEVAVPHVQHAEQHDDVLLERGVGEVFVDLVEAVQELLEAGRAEDHGEGGADGGIDGVTAADPVPEAERVVRVDAELGDLLQVGGDGDEVLLDGFGVLGVGTVDGALGLELFEQPGAGLTGVGQGFQGGEGLGNDDEQGGLRIEALGLLGQVVRVDVGDVAGGDAGVGVRLQSLVHHDGTQVGTTDADVDHGLDLLAGHAGPLAGADLVGECVDAVKGLAHVLDGVLAVDDVLALVLNRTTQRGVQHGAVLGVVDVHAGVHGLGALVKLDGLGQVGEQLQGLRLDQVLGQIEVQVASIEAQLLDALGVIGEPLLEADALGLQLVVVLLQRGPLRGLGGVNGRIDGHVDRSFHHHCEAGRDMESRSIFHVTSRFLHLTRYSQKPTEQHKNVSRVNTFGRKRDIPRFRPLFSGDMPDKRRLLKSYATFSGKASTHVKTAVVCNDRITITYATYARPRTRLTQVRRWRRAGSARRSS